MRRLRLCLPLALLAAGAAGATAPVDDEAAAIRAWRAERVVEVTGESGWLTVIGLDWLTKGTNSVGSARDNDVVLPGGTLAPHAGRFVVTDRSVRFEPAARSGITLAGRAAGALEIAPAAGRETDGSGRVLHMPLPTGTPVPVDVNRAYNPL